MVGHAAKDLAGQSGEDQLREQGGGVSLPLAAERLRRRFGKVVFVGVIFQKEKRVKRAVIADGVAAIKIGAALAARMQVFDALASLGAQLFDRPELDRCGGAGLGAGG